VAIGLLTLLTIPLAFWLGDERQSSPAL
jgi:hypothetical protein